MSSSLSQLNVIYSEALRVGYVCVNAKSIQLCPTLCDPMDYSPPGSSVHGILQARILEWAAMPSSSGSSQPRIEPMPLVAPMLQADPLLLSHWGSPELGVLHMLI